LGQFEGPRIKGILANNKMPAEEASSSVEAARCYNYVKTV